MRVHVLYDEVGSPDLHKSFLAELQNAGVQVRSFNTTQGRANRWQLNFCNHRKIVVVDGQAAWVGGLNVGDEYMGRDPTIGAWRDTHVKVTGPVVQGVQVAFLEDWHWASQKLLKLNWDPQPATSGARRVALALPTGPADTLETCTLFLPECHQRGNHRLWLASPYFVPDEQFVSALQLAALRGVDVRVLLPDEIDNKLVQLSSWSYVDDLEKVGVKVYRYQKGLMHQKVMSIDDLYCTIGTANLDNRSFRLNFEITMAFADAEFAGQLRRMLEHAFWVVESNWLWRQLTKHEGKISNHYDDDDNSDDLAMGSQRRNPLQSVSNFLCNPGASERTRHDTDQGDADLHGGKKAIGRVN